MSPEEQVENLRCLDDESLLDELITTMIYWSWMYTHAETPKYSELLLKEEVLLRMGR